MFKIKNSQKLKAMQDQELIKGLRNDQQAKKNFGHDVVSVDGDTVDVYIYDVIAWPFIEAQDIIRQIPAGAKTINIYINSPGGSVWEGTAIYNWLADHPAEKNVFVQGLAASMASVIAMVGDTISINKSAYIMIHDPWVGISGNAAELVKEAELLEKLEETMAGIYSEKTGMDAETIRSWMHNETWLNGEEASENGFATLIVADPQDIASYYNLSMFERAPAGARPAAPAPLQKHAANARKTKMEEKTMNEKLRKMLVAKGLAEDATEEKAQAFLQEMLESGTLTDDEAKAMKTEAAAAEKHRQKTLRKHGAVAGLDDTFIEKLIDDDVPLDKAQEQLFAEMERVNPPVGAGKFSAGEDESDKYRAAATDGLMMRAGQRIEKPAPGAEQFRGFEIASLIRDSLSRAGVDVSRLQSRRAVADYIIHPRADLSTSDFPSIFQDVANKTLLKAYQEAPATWRPWVNVGNATDFKTIYGISLSEAPDLDIVHEHEEYPQVSLADSQESYRVYKYGEILYLSWEMIINDDLRAFTRLPQLMGNAARRKESDLVYSLLVGNPTMNDGNSLFDASNHSNYTASGTNVTPSALDTGRVAMRSQTGPKGAKLDLRPRFLLIPVAQETDADILMRSAASTVDSKNADVYNPWYGKLEPIADPRLDDDSADSWYLIADPAQADTIEVAYLDGYEAPYLEEREEFTRDAIGWKVKHCFGCGVMDWRSFYKNSGSGA